MISPIKPILFVVSGPAGSGKSTVTKMLPKSYPDTIGLSVSYTTRAPRDGETHGVEYSFTDRKLFLKMVENGEIVEHTTYNGNLYGTPRAEIERIMGDGKDIVLEIEVDGATQIRKDFPEAVCIMMIPPDAKTLEARLRGRNSECESDISLRLERAKEELLFSPNYDYLVINHDGMEAECAKQIKSIIDAEHSKMSVWSDFLADFF